MKLTKQMIFFVVYLITNFPIVTHATLWPVFSSPDIKFLLNNNYIDTTSCPRGQGKLIPNSFINIHDSLCKTFCPPSWIWYGSNDQTCHDLSKSFELQNYRIDHVNDDEGTLYSQITASYGEKNSNQAIFQFVFTSSKERWFCIEMDAEIHNLTCANDM